VRQKAWTQKALKALKALKAQRALPGRDAANAPRSFEREQPRDAMASRGGPRFILAA